MKRRHLIYYVPVFDADTGRLLGHLVDVHMEGMKIMGKVPIKVGTRLRLRLDVSRLLESLETILAEAVIQWQSRSLNPSYYDTGLMFIDLPENATQQIQEMIGSFGFQD